MYKATDFQPIFKFLPEEWSRALLEKGNVRLATLYEFRDARDYSGKIFDEDEGKAFMTSKVDLKRTLCTLTLPNLHIYSSSLYLFSDTYIQSVEDGKNSCVMITNPTEFFQKVSNNFGLGEPMQYPCNYEGRIFPEDHKIFRSNKFSLAFQKPVEYKGHREFRAVWREMLDDNKRGFSKNVPEVIPFCIKVDIEQVNPNIINGEGKKKQIEIKVIHNDGSEPMICRYSRPFELFTPVLFQNESSDEVLIGFTQDAPDGNYRLEYASSFGGLGGIATVNFKSGPKVIANFQFLSKVEKIVVSTVDAPMDTPGYTPFP